MDQSYTLSIRRISLLPNSLLYANDAMLTQSSPVTYKPTEEQTAIIDAVGRHQVVAGQAFAGTGKTSTGVAAAHTHSDMRTLVLCFNTANAIEGKARYPASATVVTTHGLAYQALDADRRARLAPNWNVVTIKNELRAFGVREDYALASMVQGVLLDYFQSSDKIIEPGVHGRAVFTRLNASDMSIRKAGDLAKQFWAAMQTKDTVDGLKSSVNTVRIPHDAYLKQFSLNPTNWGYDLIIFDEAQDANPVTLGMLEQQMAAGAHLLYLGDRHQAIYDFRGAVNAMERLPKGAVTLPLTQSWRFGRDTAYVANLLLQDLKGETNSIIGLGEDRPFDESKPYTRLSRTNADLLAFAVAKSGNDTEETATRIEWVGGVERYRVDMLNDLYKMYSGKPMSEVSDPYLSRHFKSWGDYLEAAKYDPEAKLMSELVGQYNDKIPVMVERMKQNQSSLEEGARYCVTTGHKSKGLEWNQVMLADDFKAPLEQAEAWLSNSTKAAFPEAEVNLLYVMATRARHALKENHELEDWRKSIQSHRTKRVRQYNTSEDHGKAGKDDRPARRHPGALRFGSIKPLRI